VVIVEELAGVIKRIEERSTLPFSLQNIVLEGQLEVLREILEELRKEEQPTKGL
jgi:hypothetical protein